MSIKTLALSTYLTRYLYFNAVDVLDYEIFPARRILNAGPAFTFPYPADGSSPLADSTQVQYSQKGQEHNAGLAEFLEKTQTTAFLVIKDDQILYEHYGQGFQRSSICTSFSVAKSFVSALVGIALHEKQIVSLDDPITHYLSELKGSFWSAITIRHLVSMSSGLRYNLHGFLPWDDEPKVYYSPNLRQLARSARRFEEPGQRFAYNNYNLLLLGMILERVSGYSVSEMLQERIWKPLGMEFEASWSLDHEPGGLEKLESGLNARAIDFAKFGRLYLRKGNWNGRQILPESWVEQSTTASPDARWKNYQYLWWLPRGVSGRFMAVGNLGQFMYVAPDQNCLILRFGRDRLPGWQYIFPQVFARLMI